MIMIMKERKKKKMMMLVMAMVMKMIDDEDKFDGVLLERATYISASGPVSRALLLGFIPLWVYSWLKPSFLLTGPSLFVRYSEMVFFH